MNCKLKQVKVISEIQIWWKNRSPSVEPWFSQAKSAAAVLPINGLAPLLLLTRGDLYYVSTLCHTNQDWTVVEADHRFLRSVCVHPHQAESNQTCVQIWYTHTQFPDLKWWVDIYYILFLCHWITLSISFRFSIFFH